MNKIDFARIRDFLNKDIGPSKISPRIMTLFLKQLSLLLNSGLSLDKALIIIRDQKLDKKLTKSLEGVLYQLDQGYSAYEAFRKEEKVFGPMLIAFIKSGDESGKLADILEEYARYVDFDSKNKNQIKQALIYPIILLLVTIFVVAIIMTVVMPTFVSTFESYGVDLPITTRILIGISEAFRDYGLGFLLFILLALLGFLFLYRIASFRFRVDTLIFKYMPFKKLRSLNIEYQISSLLYILRSGDINLIECMDIIKAAFKNTYLKIQFDYIKEDLTKGLSLSKSFDMRGIFSRLLVSMVEVGEESSNLEESLDKASAYYANEYIYRLVGVSRLAEPVMILIMALIVGFVVFSVAIPMFDSVNYI
ncbi:MAG: type II secretion system F family protein [Anaerococcus sp.]|nr:type II secretion system F family protein [Anaerococcus sp.]